jgi:hypothetical protein
MARVSLKFNRKFKPDLQRTLRKRLEAVGELVASETRRELREHSTRIEGPSAVGEIPHADEGDLSKSISHRLEDGGDKVVVGTTAIHGGVHENTDRPFLKPTAVRLTKRARKILTAPIGDHELGGKGRFKVGK